jgi:hypothetical protein
MHNEFPSTWQGSSPLQRLKAETVNAWVNVAGLPGVSADGKMQQRRTFFFFS